MKHSKTIVSAMIPACVLLLGAGQAAAQTIITEIIDRNGDGAGNGLRSPRGIAVDAEYVAHYNYVSYYHTPLCA